ncbi:MAG: hypothetical protein ACK4GW_12450 [Pseudorhodobacter sp.]
MGRSQPAPRALLPRPVLLAFGLFLGLRLGFAGLWSALPDNLSPLIVTALVVADLLALAAPLLLLPALWWPQVNPGLLWSLRAGLVALSVQGLAGGLDRLADAHAGAPPPKAGAARLEVIGNVVIFSGPIDLAAFAALEETLRHSPGLRILRLTSEGGNVPAARGMARLVAETGLATEAAGLCASACTRVFIEGAPRRLRPGARLGFHGWRLAFEVPHFDARAEEARDLAAFAARGVDTGFLERAFATDPRNMWYPAEAELRAAGVLTD